MSLSINAQKLQAWFDIYQVTAEEYKAYLATKPLAQNHGIFHDALEELVANNHPNVATCTTVSIVDNFNGTVTITGTISHVGDSPITLRGFVWKNSTGPTINDGGTADGSEAFSAGSFSMTVNTSQLVTPTSYIKTVVYDGSYHYGEEITFTPVPVSLPTVTFDNYIIDNHIPAFTSLTASVANLGGATVTSRGFVYSTSPNPTIADNRVGNENALTTSGSGNIFFTNVFVSGPPNIYIRAYATNSAGTAYSNEESVSLNLCLVKGTRVLLTNRQYKNIEDITVEDSLLVWNFDEHKFDSSKPLWIKQPQLATQYNLIKLSDGSELKTVSQHRIFNVERGEFTYPMTDTTPIGTTTFNAEGEFVKIVSKEYVNEEVEYYNVITDKHINIFANNILTSCRYNNIYPIKDMTFVKDNRVLRTREEFNNIPDKYFYGLRLSEQSFTVEEIEKYVANLIKLEQVEELV